MDILPPLFKVLGVRRNPRSLLARKPVCIGQTQRITAFELKTAQGVPVRETPDLHGDTPATSHGSAASPRGEAMAGLVERGTDGGYGGYGLAASQRIHLCAPCTSARVLDMLKDMLLRTTRMCSVC